MRATARVSGVLFLFCGVIIKIENATDVGSI
jgi:hypothetical protein